MIVILSKNLIYHNFRDHIENNQRILPIIKAIKESNVDIKKPYKINRDVYRYIGLAHSWKYIKFIKKIAKRSLKYNETIFIDEDTYISPKSMYSILSSVLSIIKAVDLIEKYNYIFVPTRPPGHHVGRNGYVNISNGFCIFNNVAIGSLYFRKKYRKKNILILDIDIHHGNGTQDIIKDKKYIFFISTHAKNIYPLSGFDNGNNYYNFPLEHGIDDYYYLKLFEDKIMDLIKNLDPYIIFVSLGFDMEKRDFLSVFNISLETYKRVFELIKNLNKKAIFVLEGGYNLKVLYEGSKILFNTFK